MKHVTIYTDGSCLGNPGPGGWAAILEYGGHTREVVGADAETTNNRMELLAAVEGLRALKESCQVDLYSDSSYLVNAFAKGWVRKWQANGWQTSNRSPVKNVDLWEALDEQFVRHKIRFHYVAGHSGHPQNERCDQLAREAATRLKDSAGVAS